MLSLLHALIPCVAAYILSFELRMLLLLHACVAAYILSLLFGTIIPTPFNGNVVSLIFRCISLANTILM